MHEITPELAALAERLRTLQPATKVSREQLLYEAGRASVELQRPSLLRRAVWPASTLVVAVASLSLGRLTAPATYQPIYTFVRSETRWSLAGTSTNTAGLAVTSPDCYLRLREQLANSRSAMSFVDGNRAASPAVSRHDLFEQLLN